jgi:hypothetical protein
MGGKEKCECCRTAKQKVLDLLRWMHSVAAHLFSACRNVGRGTQTEINRNAKIAREEGVHVAQTYDLMKDGGALQHLKSRMTEDIQDLVKLKEARQKTSYEVP